jgi:hypothetical protein
MPGEVIYQWSVEVAPGGFESSVAAFKEGGDGITGI